MLTDIDKAKIISIGNRLILEQKEVKSFTVEIEVRFGYTRRSQELKRTGLTYAQFDRIRSHLDREYKNVTKSSGVDSSINLNGNYKRHRLINSIGESEENINEYSTKDKEDTINILEYNCRLAISKEIRVEPFTLNDPPKRIWIRSSYMINNCRIDLTNIREGDSTQYEIEIELINKDTLNDLILNELSTIMENIYKVIYDTHLLYTTTEKHFMERDVGQTLTQQNFIDQRYLTQARDLKYRDLVHGGIEGGDELYTVTIKADGIRKLLIRSEEH